MSLLFRGPIIRRSSKRREITICHVLFAEDQLWKLIKRDVLGLAALFK